jgi:hypothetical protein
MRNGSIEKCLAQLSADQKVIAILSICIGLEYIHGLGLIQGGYQTEFNAKLCDFGALRAADGSTATAIPMTMAYVAAELLSGEPGTVQCDVFSLGMTIFFILTGKHALDLTGKAPFAAMRLVEKGPAINLPATVKPALVQLVKRMCAVDPATRPATAREVFEAICKEKFAFFEGVDAVKVRTALSKLGVEDPFEDRTEKLVALKAKLAFVSKLLTPEQTLEVRAELAKKLEATDPAKVKALYERCGVRGMLQVLAIVGAPGAKTSIHKLHARLIARMSFAEPRVELGADQRESSHLANLRRIFRRCQTYNDIMINDR